MKIVLIISSFVFFVQSIFGQILTPVKWSYAAKKIDDNTAVMFIKATISNGWHVYSTHQKDGGPDKTSFSFSSSKDFSLVGEIIEPKAIKKFEEVFGINVMYFEKSVVFQQKIRLSKSVTVVKGTVEFMTCTEKECLPSQIVNFSIPIK